MCALPAMWGISHCQPPDLAHPQTSTPILCCTDAPLCEPIACMWGIEQFQPPCLAHSHTSILTLCCTDAPLCEPIACRWGIQHCQHVVHIHKSAHSAHSHCAANWRPGVSIAYMWIVKDCCCVTRSQELHSDQLLTTVLLPGRRGAEGGPDGQQAGRHRQRVQPPARIATGQSEAVL